MSSGVNQESSGIIWDSPAFLVFKEDEHGNQVKPRLVIDFQHTNKMLVGTTAPMPKVNKIIDHIAAGQNEVF